MTNARGLDDRLADRCNSRLSVSPGRSAGGTAVAERGCSGGQSVQFPQQAASSVVRRSAIVVDVPAMGFAWVGPSAERLTAPQPVERKGWFGQRKPRIEPPLAEENVLRNEFFEVRFDPHTGAHSDDLRLPQPRSSAGPADRPAAAPGGQRRAGRRRQLLDHGGRRIGGDLGRAGAGRNGLPRPADGPRGPPRGRVPADDAGVARQPHHRDCRSNWTSIASRAPIRGIRTTRPASPGKTRRPPCIAA